MKSRVALLIVIVSLLGSRVFAAAPTAPVNLGAIVTGNTVALSWTAPSTGTPATSYLVLASLSPGGAPIAFLPTQTTALTVTGVPNGVYCVTVRAINADGASGPSNEVIVVVPGGGGSCNAAPDAPTNFAATVVGNNVTLGWAAPAGGCPPTGYVIQAGSAPGLTDLAVLNVGAVTTLAVVAPPGTYYARVLALNAFGASAPSAEIIVTVGTTATGRVTIGFDALASVPNRSAITTYNESGFTLEATVGGWVALNTYGNPSPFIQFLRDPGPAPTFGEVIVENGGALFTFESIDLYSSITPIPYQIVGVRGGVTVFTVTGTVPNTFGAFATVRNSGTSVTVDTLHVRLTNPGNVCCSNPVGFDNLVVLRGGVPSSTP